MGITSFFDSVGSDISSGFNSLSSDASSAFGDIGTDFQGIFGGIFGTGSSGSSSSTPWLEYGLIAVGVLILVVILKKLLM